MINIQEKVFEKLSELKTEGIVKDVFFSYPNSFINLPCVSFYEVNNSICELADDKELLSEVNYVIDVWANSSTKTGEIALLVNEKLVEIGFLREVSYDVPDENIKHKFMRFKIII